MSIYLKHDVNNKVVLIHNMPIGDTKNHLAISEEEFILKGYLETGILVEGIPAPIAELPNKNNVLYANPLRWEYVDRPISQAETIEQMVVDGILTREQADDLLNK